jgi:cell pole-organizing protein PopZ
VLAGLEQDQHQSAGASFDPLENLREMSFDEEVLRDLVRDLIREELQGQLGERITRNIRKLVRAEIARALAVQDVT